MCSHSAGLWNGPSSGEDAGKGWSVLPMPHNRCSSGEDAGKEEYQGHPGRQTQRALRTPPPRCSGLDISPQSPPMCLPAR